LKNRKLGIFVHLTSGLINTLPKCIIAGEARNIFKFENASVREKQKNTLKLGSTFPIIHQQQKPFLDGAPRREAEKTVNLNERAMEVVRDWRSKSQMPHENRFPEHCEVSAGITFRISRTRDTYKSLKAITKSFSLVELLFKQSCCKADYKRWIVRKWTLRPKQ
jgi:hypothetical protein